MLKTVYIVGKGVIRVRKNENTRAEAVEKKREEAKEFIHKGFVIKCSVLQEGRSLNVSITIDKVPNEIQEEYAWAGFQYYVPSTFQQNYQLAKESISNHTYDKFEKIMDKKTKVEYVSIHPETLLPLTLHKTYALTHSLFKDVELYLLVRIQEEKKLITLKLDNHDQ